MEAFPAPLPASEDATVLPDERDDPETPHAPTRTTETERSSGAAAPPADTNAGSSDGHLRAAPKASSSDLVQLLVGGQVFSVRLSDLCRHPDTMLARMFGSSLEHGFVLRNDRGGVYAIEHTVRPSVFQLILDYHTHGFISCPPDVDVEELADACEYFCIPWSPSTVRAFHSAKLLHVLSNRGAVARFADHFLPEVLLPLFAQSAAEGERQMFVVFFSSHEHVEWSETNPAPAEEEYKKLLFNSDMWRFFNFSENRELAREVLIERGFKKVKLGIEAFPVESITAGPSVEYRYESRPYLSLSWEKEDKANRHVDFQFVRKLSTGSSAVSPRRTSPRVVERFTPAAGPAAPLSPT